MKDLTRTTVRWGLLIFVFVSVGYLFAKEARWRIGTTVSPPDPVSATVLSDPLTPDRVTATYFHGNARCISCRKIEDYSRAAIEEGFAEELRSGTLAFEVVNVEEPQNRHFIRDYSLVTKSLVLSLKEGDREVRFRNLERVWELLGSREAFAAYVQEEVRGFLNEVKR